MKILLDENLPRKLKINFVSHFEVLSVRDKNWLGKKNGELLGLMVLNGFEIFVTIDKNLPNQQNLFKFDVSIFVLSAVNNKVETLQQLVEKLKERILSGDYEKITVII